MKRVKLRFWPIVLAAASMILMLGIWPAAGMAGTTPGSDVHLLCGRVYWPSYADYLSRQLTVEYTVVNNGPGPAYNATIFTATATLGVTPGAVVPIWMGDMSAGVSNTIAFRWNVPTDVTRYVTTMSICSDCSGNLCVDGTNGGVDIKPGSCPNPINIGQGNAQVAVAVFSYGAFDALTLDDSTVIFAGASPSNVAQEDKNGDGRLDKLYHFYRDDLNLQEGDNRACLSASIIGGGTYRSCDMVVVQ